MEDAAKALIIAAGVMMGIMIMVIGVTLFVRYRNVAQTYDEMMGVQEISKINKEFEKYVGTDVRFTPQEAIGMVTTANSFNEKFYNGDYYDPNEAPIIVKINGTNYTRCSRDISGESKVKENKADYIEFIKNNINEEFKIDNVEPHDITSSLYGLIHIIKIKDD